MNSRQKTAFIFPGQGSQYIGMGKSFYDNSSLAKELFEEANEVVGFDLKNLCFEGPYSEIIKAENIQPSILTVSYIAYKVFEQEIGLKPDILLGHSFGELSALACSGVIDFKDAVYLARRKGEIAQEISKNNPGIMLVVRGVDRDVLESLCKEISDDKEKVVIAVFNNKNQMTISGNVKAVEKIKDQILNIGGEIEEFKTSAAFHSPLLLSGVEELKREVSKISFKDFKYPVLSSITRKLYQSPEDIVDNIGNSYIEPVEWYKTVNDLFEKFFSLTIEIGPQRVLTNLMPEINSEIKTYAFNKFADTQYLKKELSLGNKEIKELIERVLKITVCLKNNCLDSQVYQKEIIEPYFSIKNGVENDDSSPGWEEAKRALIYLRKVFDIKQVSKNEEEKRIAELKKDLENVFDNPNLKDFKF